MSDEECANLKSKWVINLSDRILTSDEVSLLQKGLNFAVTPNYLPVHDYIIGIETACKLVGPYSKEADRLRSDCVKILRNTELPKSNITAKERDALRTLGKDKSITILTS